jgi:K+-transporting ATPase ATPase C chain
MSQLRPAAASLVLMTLLTGVIYPFVTTGVARVFFHEQASGSLIRQDGQVIGSALIAQPFSDPSRFWGRPSATTPPCNAANSGGSNLGPLNPDLRNAVQERVRVLKQADPDNAEPAPVDLVTASGSGLDPHISPAAALCQVRRVARARGMDEAVVKRLVEEHIENRQLGILGEPRVNVLLLNLSLDQLLK